MTQNFGFNTERADEPKAIRLIYNNMIDLTISMTPHQKNMMLLTAATHYFTQKI